MMPVCLRMSPNIASGFSLSNQNILPPQHGSRTLWDGLAIALAQEILHPYRMNLFDKLVHLRQVSLDLNFLGGSLRIREIGDLHPSDDVRSLGCRNKPTALEKDIPVPHASIRQRHLHILSYDFRMRGVGDDLSNRLSLSCESDNRHPKQLKSIHASSN